MKKKSQKLLRLFRIIGIAEGISFLILLVIAMPLKYFFKIPEAVKVFGWFLKAFIAAFVPLGTFIFDRQLKKDEVLLAEDSFT